MTTIEILTKAKAEVLRRGLCKGRFLNKKGECCMFGAIWCAMGVSQKEINKPKDNGLHIPMHILRLLEEATQSCHVPEWNDTPSRTIEEVCTAFDKAIALAHENPGIDA